LVALGHRSVIRKLVIKFLDTKAFHMSKKLFLIRHAKAEESHGNQKDADRYLTPAGMHQANQQGQRLHEAEIMPDLILSSSAERARMTAEEIAQRIKYDLNRIQYEEDLYEASVRTLLRVINELDEKYQTVFILGHNPTISYLSEYLTQADIGTVDAAGMVELSFEVERWAEISEGTAHLVNYWKA
jgi:phosphohistidine phosphatase